MGKINLLDVEISNKIAAGEVVERPASVVKELVENSIDAGASKITVEIKNGGNTYIKITDNGSGMEKDDATVAFLRHATSKISTAEDLNSIATLGFRGEALSSIGAVAQVDLYTKRREDSFGTHTICEGGEIISSEDAGAADGTVFIVKNLFYNVPARQKFLKKDATEAAYISDIMTRFILAHPEISFKLISNSKQAMFSSGDGKLLSSVYSVYGKDYAQSMIDVDFKSEYVGVNGLIGKGTCARPNRNYQSFFVNKRYIRSPMIARAVEEAYKNQIMTGKFPTAVLNIEINPSLVDINVHPTKLEVKFSNENEVYRTVYNAVKEALYRIADIPEIKRQPQKKSDPLFDALSVKEQVIFVPPESMQKPLKIPTPTEKIGTPLYENPLHNVASPKMFDFTAENIGGHIPDAAVYNFAKKSDVKPPQIQKAEVTAPTAQNSEQEVTKNTEFELIGQVFNTYIIIEQENNMLIIDQHAAHERLNYEELLSELENNGVYSQSILIPEVINLTSSEMAIFLQNNDFIHSLGFEAEQFGDNSVIVRSVPSNLNEDIAGLFIEILSQLDEFKREIISKKRQRLLYTIACKTAVKANHALSEQEQYELVKNVLSLNNINTCPHGRPIIISMSQKEIEKEFKRIV